MGNNGRRSCSTLSSQVTAEKWQELHHLLSLPNLQSPALLNSSNQWRPEVWGCGVLLDAPPPAERESTHFVKSCDDTKRDNTFQLSWQMEYKFSLYWDKRYRAECCSHVQSCVQESSLGIEFHSLTNTQQTIHQWHLNHSPGGCISSSPCLTQLHYKQIRTCTYVHSGTSANVGIQTRLLTLTVVVSSST